MHWQDGVMPPSDDKVREENRRRQMQEHLDWRNQQREWLERKQQEFPEIMKCEAYESPGINRTLFETMALFQKFVGRDQD